MSLLQYTSKEMFSSTELVRKSKNIFDKLNKKEIEKAIVLRDGKPGIILLDFNEYEKIMNDYLKLKEKSTTQKEKSENEIVKKEFQEEEKKVENDFSIVLDDLEKLELEINSNSKTAEPLKEFWD
jgi:hypothetical protein